ncbi:MAG: PAS domain S-box protein [Proteobacteria bacterium]|nr:PAS domain S-box protein [Pseudomonadota bacterium]MBU1742536.1 PAS domain S-box protein [Pseudomonadota bacterium]
MNDQDQEVRRLRAELEELGRENARLQDERLRRRRVEDDLHQRAEDLVALNRLGLELGAARSPESLLATAVDRIDELVSPDFSLVFLRQNGRLILQDTGRGDSGRPPEIGSEHRVGECLCGLAASQERPVYSDDLRHDPRCTRPECGRAGVHSLAALPLQNGDGTIGVLALASFSARRFGEMGAFLDPLAKALARGLDNALVYERIQGRFEEVRKRLGELEDTQATLEESEEYYHLLLETGPDAVIIVDNKGALLDANQRALSLWDYDGLDEARRAVTNALEWVAPADRNRFVDHVRETYQQGAVRTEQYLLVKRGETPFPAEVTVAVGNNDQGLPRGAICLIRDLTDRWLAEEQLREIEEDYRTLVENVNVGIYRTSGAPPGRIVRANPAMVDMFGFDSFEELAVVPVVEMYQNTQERALFLEELRHRGMVRSRVLRLRKKDGSFFLASCTATIRRGPDDSVKWIDGVMEDVTERVRIEEALYNSERQYRTTIESLGDPIFVLDRDLRLILSNQALKNWMDDLDLSTDVLGRPMAAAFPCLPETTLESYRRVFATGRGSITEDRIEAGGREVITETRRIPVFEGREVARVVAVVRDITERKRAEEDLRRSERKYRELIETMNEGLGITDENYVFTYVNNRFAEMLGYDVSEMGGRHILDFVDEDDQEIMARQIDERQQGERKPYELVWAAKDGRRVHSIISPMGFYDDQGVFTGSFGVVTDITERVEAEREFRELEEQLFQSQKMEAVGTLASGIAHDFNNLLHAISGYVQLLQTGKRKAHARYLSEIEAAVDRATELVRRLLTFSRKVEHEFQPLDLNQEVIQTVKILERTIPKMIGIETDLGEDLKPVQGDRTQLEQIVMNLGANARDAMPDGGRLRIKTENALLDETYCRTHVEATPGEYVRLRVSDTGQGMDAHTMAHIFEPFFTTKAVGEGTGLGLSTAYGIVRGHGGHITCHSQPGQGTTFDVYWPAHEAAVAKRAAAAEPEAPVRGGDETILLVDDDQPVLDIGRAILEEFGYEVLAVTSGEEALEVYGARLEAVDLAVIDLIMPGMGGRACLRELLAIRSDLPVIVASGHLVHGQEERMLDAGARGFVAKPYRLGELLKRVREVLDTTA